VIVTTDKGLQQLCERIRRIGRMALDTEFIGEQSYRPKICLAQVAAPDLLAVIDTLAISTLTPLWDLLTDSSVLIITHAGRNDFAACYRWVGQAPRNVFDTQIAAGLVGVGYPLSYADLVRSVLAVRLPKMETLTDWSRRPLHPKQIEYALEDVRHLLPLYDQLSARLKELGREDWARQEFAPLQDESLYRVDESQLYRRVKGAGTLQPRQLAVLRTLAVWREQKAHERDRPVRSILPDYFLLELARRQPKTLEQLKAVRGLTRRMAAEYARPFLAAIAEAVDLPEDQLPAALSRRVPTVDCKVAVDLAAAMVTHLARKHHVTAELLATRGDLEAYFRWRLGGSEGPPKSLTDGWRREILTEPLDDLFTGRATVALRRSGKKIHLDVKMGNRQTSAGS
jgi:ribonuclease D